MLWYAQEEKAGPYLQRLTDNINSYNDENWIHKYPEKEYKKLMYIRRKGEIQ
jgi:hypothetical protein